MARKLMMDNQGGRENVDVGFFAIKILQIKKKKPYPVLASCLKVREGLKAEAIEQ